MWKIILPKEKGFLQLKISFPGEILEFECGEIHDYVKAKKKYIELDIKLAWLLICDPLFEIGSFLQGMLGSLNTCW